MKPPSEKQAASELSELLAELLGVRPRAIRVDHVGATKGYDYAISAGGPRFMAEYKSNASTGAVAAAVDGLNRLAETRAIKGLPLVVVPFMGPVGRQICDQAHVSWLDLSGNAKIV